MNAVSCPTLAGFQDFINNIMGIDPLNLPPSQPVIAMAFQMAVDTVNPDLRLVGARLYQPSVVLPAYSLYSVAVYNLAADFLINWAPDVPKQGQDPDKGFFAQLRKRWKLDNWAAGVVATTTDASTSTALEVIDAAKNFTMSDLQNLRTPYGRTYLGIAQKYGPTIWGIS